MKNQYFGDINDYRKYGLLRVIVDCTKLRLLVGWMLTPDDGSTDGKFTAYLDDPDLWSIYDKDLLDGLTALMTSGEPRGVGMIEATDLLGDAKFYSALVPDDKHARSSWGSELLESAESCEFVFLDPDNGLEVPSRPIGRKNSSKYAYWSEVQALWAAGKSLLIYQHFPRENRPKYVQRMLDQLRQHTPGSLVEAFSTKFVVFLMALQPPHHGFHQDIVDELAMTWFSEFAHSELVLENLELEDF